MAFTSSLPRKRSRLDQQPAAWLLVERVVAVADGRLGHLGDQRLGIAQRQVHHWVWAGNC